MTNAASQSGSSANTGSGGTTGGGGGATTPATPPAATPAPVAPADPATAVSPAPELQSAASVATGASVSLSAVSIKGSLTVGSSGSEVEALQSFLETKGFLTMPKGVAKGYFGSLTKQALIAYQQSAGLSASGKVDAATRSALGGGASSSPAPAPASVPAAGEVMFKSTLKRGSSGSEVKQLQVKLQA